MLRGLRHPPLSITVQWEVNGIKVHKHVVTLCLYLIYTRIHLLNNILRLLRPFKKIQPPMSPKTAYITGGASGIGLAVAKALNQRGMRIVIADINLAAAQEAVKALQESAAAKDCQHLAVEVDVSSWESQLAAFEQTIRAVTRLDIVIVNAGVGEKVFVPNDGGKGSGFVKPNLGILEVDLNGFLYTSALAIQQMRRQEPDREGIRGRIVGTASVCGFYCVPSKCRPSVIAKQITDNEAALPVYTAAKQ